MSTKGELTINSVTLLGFLLDSLTVDLIYVIVPLFNGLTFYFNCKETI